MGTGGVGGLFNAVYQRRPGGVDFEIKKNRLAETDAATPLLWSCFEALFCLKVKMLIVDVPK